MLKGHFKKIVVVLVSINLFSAISFAQVDRSEAHRLVSLRMIGHKLLLNSGDSTSQVLPITKKENRYKIQFQKEFQFKPEELVATIDNVVKKSQISNGYFVEVEKCETGEVIYSYEIGDSAKADIIPCGTRKPEKACYNILLTILDSANLTMVKGSSNGNRPGIFFIVAILLITALMGIGMVMQFRKKKLQFKIDPNVVMIGAYQFDTMNSALLIQDQRVSLSAKESDLLLLLYSAANTTVEREVILKKIWGDEGDYIGRTLDVFISKLRKKLEVDTNLKIVNIRGVGYKLLMNVER